MALISDTYFSISAPSEGLFKDKGSRFLAFATPVESEAEVKALTERLRKEYHDARHCCVAYRIGLDGSIWRASDDGEPAGSAGRPILGQIDSAGLSDVAVAVVRYFGGIKLGVPGLINAYRSATADALAAATRIEKVAGRWFRLEFGYDALPQVMKAVKDLSLPQRAQDFGGDFSGSGPSSDSGAEALATDAPGAAIYPCSMEVRVRLSLLDDFRTRLALQGVRVIEI